MIPILFDSNATQFDTNGLGRLIDCISCEVTEERNGVYECEFVYPIDGRNYDKITLERIIAVTHDSFDDLFGIHSGSCNCRQNSNMKPLYIGYFRTELSQYFSPICCA